MTCRRRRRAFASCFASAKSFITKWEKFAALMKKLAAGGFLLLSAPFINNPTFIQQHMVPIMNPKSLRRLRPLDNDVFGSFLSTHTASWKKASWQGKKRFSSPTRSMNRKRGVFVFLTILMMQALSFHARSTDLALNNRIM